MGSTRNVPEGADTLEVLSGIITKQDAWTFGKKVTLTHKVFYGSDGFKSDYQAHRIEYVILAIEGEKTRAFRYSGKNLPHATKMKEDLRPWLTFVCPETNGFSTTQLQCSECGGFHARESKLDVKHVPDREIPGGQLDGYQVATPKV